MIGQLLDRRYRIIKILSAGEFGQTYLAADTHRPGYPQCLVRQLRPPSNNPRTLQIIELLFKKKAESLEKLGRHDQIPQLLAFFEENKEFYLVEEFIPGHPLSTEIGQGKRLNEEVIIRLLQEILEILVFVHGHGIVHGEITPESLIRRHQDGKLVLIDFGPVKEISSQLMKAQGQNRQNGTGGGVTYLPQEQYPTTPLYNSDLYAAGAIAIQALTGLSVQEIRNLLSVNGSNSGGKQWQQLVNVNTGLCDILEKMVHPDIPQRYQSATEVLADLRKVKAGVPVISPPLPPNLVPRATNPLAPSRIPVATAEVHQVPRQKQALPRLVLLLAGIGVAIALVALGFLLYSTYAKHRVRVLKNTGVERAQSGDKEGGLNQLNKAISLDPNNPEVYYKRGNVHYSLGNYQAAIEDYSETIRLDPNKVDAYYNRGLAAYDAGSYPAAVKDFTQVLQEEPNDAEASYKRGLAYHELEDYDAAIADYTQAIRLDPDLAKTAYLNRGLSRSAAGDKQGAIADFTEAIQLNPKNADAFYSRGRSRFFLADYQGATDDYSAAIGINPQEAAYYANRCGAYLNLFDYPKAIADCTKAIELNPQDATAYGNRCIAYVNTAEYPKAVEDCTQAIQLNPDNAKYYSNRGLARSVAGDREGAIDDYTKAIQLIPSDAVAFNNRGEAYVQMGNFSQAISDFTQAIRLKSDYDTAYYNRGMVRIKLGDKAGAIEDLQKAGTLCLDLGKAGCYNDAQFQIRQLRGEG